MNLDEKPALAIKVDVLSTIETQLKLEDNGVGKVSMPLHKSIILGVLAGIFIAMGGVMLGAVFSDAALSFVIQRILGGLTFCVGLILVVMVGAELFTGNNLIIMGVLSGRVSWGAYIKNLVIVWLANLAGSLIAVAIVFFADTGALNSGAVGDTFINLAAAKVSYPPLTLFAKAIICNFMVCLAVWLTVAGRTMTDKLLGILFPITTFVVAGGEHSVANMFFLPMGYVQKLAGRAVSDAAIAAADKIDLTGILYNLGMVTLGNMVGGIILVGVVYWFALRWPKKKVE